MLRPLVSANVRSTALRSAPWKSKLIGWPVYVFGGASGEACASAAVGRRAVAACAVAAAACFSATGASFAFSYSLSLASAGVGSAAGFGSLAFFAARGLAGDFAASSAASPAASGAADAMTDDATGVTIVTGWAGVR